MYTLLLNSRPVCSVARRLCSTKPSSSTSSSSYSADGRNLWEKTRDFFYVGESEAFRSDFVRRSFQWDKVNAEHWAIIYRDVNASRTFAIMAFAIPIGMAGAAFLLYQAMTYSKKERHPMIQRLVKDIEQLGLIAALPLTVSVLVTAILLRVHSLRVLRIYQHRSQPDKYIAIIPYRFLLQNQMKFNRSSSIHVCLDGENDYKRLGHIFLLGNVQIGGRRFVVDDGAFRANNYRSFMLNETSIPPRLTEMDDREIPIDIHSGKLLDWLLSRRHCGKEWQKRVVDIREKIKHAILDMPENAQIVNLLKGGYINYFHVIQIVTILKDTEKDTKNFLGFYSSQRMRDWQEIESLYKKDAVGLAEAAQLLQRVVQYDIPALKKAVHKSDQAVQEGARKEKEYIKLAGDSKKAYEKELSRIGLEGDKLRSELLALASDLPAFFQEVAEQVRLLRPARDYYVSFRDYLHGGHAPEAKILPLLALIMTNAAEVTVFEWRYGKSPNRVEKPNFETLIKDIDEKENAEHEIDFGDGDIDFGDDEINLDDDNIAIDIVADDTGLVSEDGVARGEEALGVMEYEPSLRALKEELLELIAFMSSREKDEETEAAADIFILGSEIRPDSINNVSISSLSSWLASSSSIVSYLNNPHKQHLFKIRSSPQYVETVVEDLLKKKNAEGRFMQMAKLAEERQVTEQNSLQEYHNQLRTMMESTKTLKKQIEEEISKKYNGRIVNIMGGIHQALSPV